jgi:hypothetical protein
VHFCVGLALLAISMWSLGEQNLCIFCRTLDTFGIQAVESRVFFGTFGSQAVEPREHPGCSPVFFATSCPVSARFASLGKSEVGGVSPTGKSFRVVPCVRACVRAVWMPSENQIKFRVWGLPFSLLSREAFPFPLGDLV